MKSTKKCSSDTTFTRARKEREAKKKKKGDRACLDISEFSALPNAVGRLSLTMDWDGGRPLLLISYYLLYHTYLYCTMS